MFKRTFKFTPRDAGKRNPEELFKKEISESDLFSIAITITIDSPKEYIEKFIERCVSFGLVHHANEGCKIIGRQLNQLEINNLVNNAISRGRTFYAAAAVKFGAPKETIITLIDYLRSKGFIAETEKASGKKLEELKPEQIEIFAMWAISKNREYKTLLDKI